MKEFLSKGVVLPHIENLSEPLFITLFVLCVFASMIFAYLLGSLNFAIIISGKQYRQDIREFGSKNAGMTNMMRTYGKKAAAMTLIGDALKAVVAGLIGYTLLGDMGAYIAGLFCILGHMFPIYYRFKGGKGVVTAGVAVLMCNPPVFLVLIILFVIIVAIYRYISLASIICMALYPIVLNGFYELLLNRPVPLYSIIIAILMAVLVVFKHWENINRLRQGKESKFSFKKSVKASDVSEAPVEKETDSHKN